MVELLRRMHEAGVPLLAGTDGSGLEIVRYLEIYAASVSLNVRLFCLTFFVYQHEVLP